MDKSTLEDLYDLFLAQGHVTTDSRNCKRGSIFFALRGDRFDGNQYVDQALAGGCHVAVADDPVLKGRDGVFFVDNALVALQQLARYHRYQLDIPIVGITGTNGKTTTKELVSKVLAEKFNVYCTQGNLNNHIGVPLTLLSMNNSTEIGVVEMGANHVGEIELLSAICKPNYGLITNIGYAHLEGFGSYEGVKTGKSELYRHIKSNDGILFVNSDDEVLMELSREMPRILYGKNDDGKCAVVGKNVSVNPFLAFEMDNQQTGEHLSVQTNLIGKYNIDNVLAAACIGVYFGLETSLIVRALENYNPTNNRSQLIDTQRNKVLMDAYNANPSSMQVAIENFAGIDHSRKILILGGMKELGGTTVCEHQKLLEQIVQKEFNEVFLVGDEFRALDIPPAYQWFADVHALIVHLSENPISGAFVLIKGSRGNKMELIQPIL
ncbi:MAG: UDP-N-acetylmuramoyl-tripeptide--D-alanyl-D-alanine ligase [Breznakibacter sp.]